MDYVRRIAGMLGVEAGTREVVREPKRVHGLKPRTGPLPTVPWRDLSRRGGVEQHLSMLLLLAFGLLAMIQYFLRG